MLASALHAARPLQDAYGFTRLRLAAEAVILWLGAVFVLVLAAGAASRPRWLPRAVLAALGHRRSSRSRSATRTRRIAERNIDRYERTGRIDLYMLRHLSADAVPALGRFAMPSASAPTPTDRERSTSVARRARAACARLGSGRGGAFEGGREGVHASRRPRSRTPSSTSCSRSTRSGCSTGWS